MYGWMDVCVYVYVFITIDEATFVDRFIMGGMGCMYGQMDGWMDVYMDRWIVGWMDG